MWVCLSFTQTKRSEVVSTTQYRFLVVSTNTTKTLTDVWHQFYPVLKNLKLLCFIGWKWRHISFKWHCEPPILDTFRSSILEKIITVSLLSFIKSWVENTMSKKLLGAIKPLSGLGWIMPGSLSSTFSREGSLKKLGPNFAKCEALRRSTVIYGSGVIN